MLRLRPTHTVGFTLVELLVVVAIVGLLIGMLLPAVQKVREAANRIKCRSNLKQLGLATHAYHDAQGILPVNSLLTADGPYGSNTRAWSWLARILPYVEQGDLANLAGIPDQTLIDARGAISAEVRLFLCPSDPSAQGGARSDAADLGLRPHGPAVLAGQTNARTVKVQGVNGVVGGDDTGLGAAVVWIKNGRVYGVAGTFTQDQLLAVANSLR